MIAQLINRIKFKNYYDNITDDRPIIDDYVMRLYVIDFYRMKN